MNLQKDISNNKLQVLCTFSGKNRNEMNRNWQRARTNT